MDYIKSNITTAFRIGLTVNYETHCNAKKTQVVALRGFSSPAERMYVYAPFLVKLYRRGGVITESFLYFDP